MHLLPQPRRSERGVALIGVLLLLMMMSALAGALTVSGHTETLVARNHQTAAQARAAAEAGLNHAAESTIAWLLAWKLNGYTDVDQAIVALLNNPSIVGVAMGTEITTSGITYEVMLMDEDDPARNVTLDPNDVGEDGIATSDLNRAVVIRAEGYGENGAEAVLEGIVMPYKLPAVAANGNLTMNGQAGFLMVIGAEANGGVHANGDLTFSGATAIVGFPDTTKGTATATGDCPDCALPTITTNPDGSGGGRLEMAIPDIRASDFSAWADFILQPDPNDSTRGLIINASTGATVCSTGPSGNGCRNSHGWTYSKQSGQWDLTTTAANGSTYYVKGPATVSGGSVLDPIVATIIAEGTISASGNGVIVPDAGDLLFVTDVDLVLGGTFRAGAELAEGQMLAREQIQIASNVVLFGQIVAGNATSTATPHESSVGGSAAITNNQDIGSSMFRVGGWSEVR